MTSTANLFSDEALWQRTFDAVPDLIFVVDDEYRIVRANRAAARRVGCAVDQLAGRRCYELIHGTPAPPETCPYARASADGRTQSVEFREFSLGGEFAITVTPLRDGQGRVLGAVHVAHDVTELKRVETELRRSRDQLEQRHALAVATMLDGLWERDYGTGRVAYSDRFLELVGYSREEAPPALDFVYGIMHPDDAPAVRAAVERHLADRVPLQAECRLRTKGGEYRWFLTRGQAHWDAAGQPVRTAGTILDITERKQAEEERAERGRFDGLLADISARFVGLAAERVMDEIAAGLAQVREFFGLDRLGLRTYGENAVFPVDPSFLVCADGVRPIDPALNLKVLFPWCYARLAAGEPVVMAPDQMPPEAGEDRLAMERFGIQSGAAIPISIGGCPQYLLVPSTSGRPRAWTPDLLQRMKLLGEIFVQALSHRRAELELTEAELKYRTLADFSSDWEYWQDAEQRFRYISPSCEEITGYAQEEFEADFLLLREIVLPDDRPLWDAHWWRCHQGCQAGSLEFRILRRDGRVVWLSHACRPVRDPRGQLLGIRVNNRDVTEQRSAKETLATALAQIEHLKERLERENVYLQNEIKSQHDFQEIVGQSEALRATLQKISLVSETGANVLLLGETGTGKELLARAIHDRSSRRDRPLVKVNCAALPSSLIESELFGHVQGAFTGALSDKIGRFELAHGGTLFLDEIGELAPDLQTKLLRVLQDGEFERLGSSQTIRADVRLITATNRDLQEALREETFRPDLYYRLSVFPIEVPPLRVRPEDIPLLVWHFITAKQRRLGKTIKNVPREVMNQLVRYDWPGNVRELENVIERAIILSSGTTLTLSESLGGTRPPSRHRRGLQPSEMAHRTAVAESDSGSLAQVDRAHILAVLDECGWKIKGPGNAAERLGLKPSTLRFRMKKLDIQRRPKPR